MSTTTPGQAAYEKWNASFTPDERKICGLPAWEYMASRLKAIWETVANAARDIKPRLFCEECGWELTVDWHRNTDGEETGSVHPCGGCAGDYECEDDE